MQSKFYYFFFLIWIFYSCPATLWASADLGVHVGATSGENLTYNIHWMGIPAGQAGIRLEQKNDHEYFIYAFLESIGVVKLLHPIHDILQASGFRKEAYWLSCQYVKIQEKKAKEKRTEHKFLRQEFAVEKRINQEPPERMEMVDERVNDPLTAIFILRSMPQLQSGQIIQLPLLDGAKFYNAKIKVGTAENLFTPMGWFKAFPIEIAVENSELFRHDGALTIWLTFDERRLPLRVQTQYKMTPVVADLTHYIDGRGGSGQILEKR
ncbi:MAG: DUF3108 domain-containing protein [Magnetococcus sp. DMHC-6]